MGLFDKKTDSTDGVFLPTKEIAAAFMKHDLKCTVNTTSDASVVDAGFSGNNISQFHIHFISRSDEHDVAVRAFNIVPSVPEAKRTVMLNTINRCNEKYRFIKYTLQEDNSLSAQYDMPIRSDCIGEAAVEIAIRFLQIIDESYPEFMKAMWS